MTEKSKEAALLLVGHGSRNEDANQGFKELAGRLGKRLGREVAPAFFSIASPALEDVIRERYVGGWRKFVLMPYFLYRGQHVRSDLPNLLAACKSQMPGIDLTLLPTLENDTAVEDVVLGRLYDHAPLASVKMEGREIEEHSKETIDTLLSGILPDDPSEREVVKRVVHATADLAFARTVLIRPGAIQSGVEAIRRGITIFTDVKMLAAGISGKAGNCLCGIDDPEVASRAAAAGSTRAAEAVEKYAGVWADGIIAIGNAPTAIWRLLELCRKGARPPAVVVGMPVGFVGAAEAKQALWESGLPCITNSGRRGGSPAAAAAVNALTRLTVG